MLSEQELLKFLLPEYLVEYFDITKIINKKNINIQYRNIEANI